MFILNLTPINRNIGGPAQQPMSTQGKDADGAFQEGMKGNGYDKGDLDSATSKRTRLTRAGRTELAKTSSAKRKLFDVDDDNGLNEKAEYRTIMVDGILFTLRLLAVA